MSGIKISIDELSGAIANQLKLYEKDVMNAVNEETERSAKELVTLTRQTAPVGKRKKHYKSNITCKKIVDDYRKCTWLWYVKGSDYRLSHLLEKGHALRNGGRTRGTHFIRNACNKILPSYEERVKRANERL